jgi:hypothetical protein
MPFNVKVGMFVSWQKCTASSSEGCNINVLRFEKRDLYLLVPTTEREREREREIQEKGNEYHVASLPCDVDVVLLLVIMGGLV